MEQQLRDTKIRLCLDCGKCTVVCPVAQHDPQFNPRLIAQRRLTQTEPVSKDESIWDCISCYMCVERCNYMVKFPEFIHAIRAEALAEGVRLPCSHGGTLQSLMRLMTRPDLQQNRLTWLPNDIKLSQENDTIFFVGCAPYFDIIFNNLGVTTLNGVKGAVRLLNRAKVPFNILQNERCCGRDLLLGGDKDGFITLAKFNDAEFKRQGVKKIICNCSECYYTLKVDYPKILGTTGLEILHITEVVAPLVKSEALSLGKLEIQGTYHDPCSLGRCSRIFDAPRSLLQAVIGLELIEMKQNKDKALCCGASPWLHCGAINRQIQVERLTQAKSTGTSLLITSCPKCQIHLRCAQKDADESLQRITIRDLSDLLSESIERG